MIRGQLGPSSALPQPSGVSQGGGGPSAVRVVGGGGSAGQEEAEANPAPLCRPPRPLAALAWSARGRLRRAWSSRQQAAGGACGGSGLCNDIFKPKPQCCLQPFLSHFLLEDSVLARLWPVGSTSTSRG